jgi:hypothetical protein
VAECAQFNNGNGLLCELKIGRRYRYKPRAYLTPGIRPTTLLCRDDTYASTFTMATSSMSLRQNGQTFLPCLRHAARLRRVIGMKLDIGMRCRRFDTLCWKMMSLRLLARFSLPTLPSYLQCSYSRADGSIDAAKTLLR